MRVFWGEIEGRLDEKGKVVDGHDGGVHLGESRGADDEKRADAPGILYARSNIPP